MSTSLTFENLCDALDLSGERDILEAIITLLKGPGFDDKKTTADFFSLVTRAFPTATAAEIGSLWGKTKKRFARPRENPQEAVQEPLESLVRRLVFPLGLNASEWLQAQRLAEEDGDASRVPFLICRVSGLVIRIAAAVAVRTLVNVGSKDAMLNGRVVKDLQLPSDGKWLSLSKRIADTLGKRSAEPGNAWSSWAVRLSKTFDERRHAQVANKTISGHDALDKLNAFRNDLIHGNTPSPEDLSAAAMHLEVALRSFAWLADCKLRLRASDTEWAIDGFAPSRVEAAERVMPPGLVEGEVYLIDPSGGLPPLSLTPLLVFQLNDDGEATIEVNELWFLNAGSLERLSYISFRSHSAASGKSLRSYESFKTLLAALPTPPIPTDPRFDDAPLAEFHERLFVGRRNVLDEIARYVQLRPVSWAVVTALPGMGKSALMAALYSTHSIRGSRLAELDGDAWIFHFCSAADGRNSPTAALRSLIAQLDDLTGGSSKEISTDLDELRDRLLPDRLSAVANELRSGQKLVLAIDALDEGFGAEQDSVAEVLPATLPANVVGILSWRVNGPDAKNDRVEKALSHLPRGDRKYLETASPLVGLDQADVDLLLAKLGREQGLEATIATRDAVWRAATRDVPESSRASADPFYLRLVAEGVWAAEVRLDRAETVPSSLDEAFEALWMTLPTDLDFLAHRVFLYLAVLREPATDELLAALISQERPRQVVGSDDIAAIRMRSGKLLVYEGERYRLFHDRFKRFLVGEDEDPITLALQT